MSVQSNNQVARGRSLFLAIVAITVVLLLAPALTGTVRVNRLIYSIATVVLYSFLAYSTYRGYDWARIALAGAYLLTLTSSIPSIWYRVSSMQGFDPVQIAFDILSIGFAVFSAVVLLGSKSFMAYVKSNETRHRVKTQTVANIPGSEISSQPKTSPWLRPAPIHYLILGSGAFFVFTQCIWETFFLAGILPGVYWLFYYLDKWFLSSIGLAFLLAGAVFLVWILRFTFLNDNTTHLIVIFGALVVVGAATFILTFPATLAHNTRFIEELRVGNRVFYLSAYPMFGEINYGVAECEFTGLLCRTIFVSGDISGTDWRQSHLRYDEDKQEIILMEAEKGNIFSTSLQ